MDIFRCALLFFYITSSFYKPWELMTSKSTASLGGSPFNLSAPKNPDHLLFGPFPHFGRLSRTTVCWSFLDGVIIFYLKGFTMYLK